jgi:tricarballylate dehydrogenase
VRGRRDRGAVGADRPQYDRPADLAALAGRWDVVVIGGGNAALVSALTARDEGASVLVLECADPIFRGGNSRHTRNIRCVHDGTDSWNTGPYDHDELWADLCGVGTGPSNEELARLTVTESESVPAWMIQHGSRFQPALTGTLHLGRTNSFFLGGGKALMNGYYRHAAAAGIRVVYEARVTELEFDGLRCTGLVVDIDGTDHRVSATSVVCASGGFEANIEWLRKYWGDAALNYLIRGPRYNDGTVLRQLLDHGANTAGEERGFHSVAVDARSPKFDGGIATRIDSIPFGVVVNAECVRFYDEGEDVWPKRYAIWGRNIALQPDQIAYGLWDSKVQGRFLPPMYGVHRAGSIREIADLLGIDADRTDATVAEYNRTAPADGADRFDPAKLDGVATSGLAIPKSNWAQRLDTPPYYGIAMRPGITFTYMGVEVNGAAQIRTSAGEQFANVFAAGEIMSGNVLSTGYLAGFGMTIGTVWGRIAGREAARHALR